MAVRTRLHRLTLAALLWTAALSFPGLVSAQQQGEWQWEARAVAVVPDDSCQPIADLGTVLTLNTTAGVGFDVGYGLSRVLAAHLSIAVSHHTLCTSGGSAGGLDAGSVWLAPVAMTLHYRLPLLGSWHPYAALGIAYGQLFGYDISSEIQEHSLGDLDFKGSTGLALQAGVVYDAGELWFASLDVSHLQLANEVTLINRGGATFAKIDLDVNPWQFGLGIGRRF